MGRECSDGIGWPPSRLFADALSALADTGQVPKKSRRMCATVQIGCPGPFSVASCRMIQGQSMNLAAVGLAMMVAVLIGVIPAWPYSRAWGYAPTGIVGAELLVLLTLLVMDRI